MNGPMEPPVPDTDEKPDPTDEWVRWYLIYPVTFESVCIMYEIEGDFRCVKFL